MPTLEELFGTGLENISNFPPPTADVVVYKNYSRQRVIAKKFNYEEETWERIADGKAGVSLDEPRDDAKVMQAAIDSLQETGGKVKITGNYFVTQPIQITYPNADNPNVNLRVTGEFCNIVHSGDLFVFDKCRQCLGFPIFEGFQIFGNKDGSAFHIIDSYHVEIRDCQIQFEDVGVLLEIHEYWTESTLIENCKIHYNKSAAIKFLNSGSPHNSFDQTRIIAVDSEIADSTCIYIGENCSVYRSIIELICWANGGTVLKVDGAMPACLTHIKADGQGTLLSIGENAGEIRFFATYSPSLFAIDNPYNKSYVIEYKSMHFKIPNTYTEVIRIDDDDGEFLAINKSSSGDPVIGTYGRALSFWDYKEGKSSAVNLGSTIVSSLVCNANLVCKEIYVGDYGGSFASFTPPAPVKGKVFFAQDTNATAPGKRLYICLDGSTWSYVSLT